MINTENHYDDYLKYVSSLKKYSKHTVISYENDLCLFKNWITEMSLKFLSLRHRISECLSQVLLKKALHILR